MLASDRRSAEYRERRSGLDGRRARVSAVRLTTVAVLRGSGSMEITRDEVLHVARLARLQLTDAEVERFRGQLSAILEAVSKVSELDLADVPPTSHPHDVVNVW